MGAPRYFTVFALKRYGTGTRGLLDTGDVTNLIYHILCDQIMFLLTETAQRVTGADFTVAVFLGALTGLSV